MPPPFPIQELAAFLHDAKFATYATQGDQARVKPLLAGSKQLEYRAGDFFYRDIYVGMFHFVGQEIAHFRDTPVWSMSYAGGMLPTADMSQARDIYALLRQALRHMPSDQPFRGPPDFAANNTRYENALDGNMERFHGQERIYSGEALLYELHYSGGLLL